MSLNELVSPINPLDIIVQSVDAVSVSAVTVDSTSIEADEINAVTIDATTITADTLIIEDTFVAEMNTARLSFIDTLSPDFKRFIYPGTSVMGAADTLTPNPNKTDLVAAYPSSVSMIPASTQYGTNYKRILIASTTGSGTDTLIYTVPTGKKAIFRSLLTTNNNINASTYTCRFSKDAGATKLLIITTSSTAQFANATLITETQPFVFSAGDLIYVSAAAATVGCTYQGAILEFSSSIRLQPIFPTAIASGNNTIYTCPAGYRAQMCCPTVNGLTACGSTSSQFRVYHLTGTIVYTLTIGITSLDPVSGPAIANYLIGTASASANTVTTLTANVLPYLNPGDTLILNAASTDLVSYVYGAIAEFPIETFT